MTGPDPYRPWLERWRLVPDGEPLVTPSSHLLPVRRTGMPAILKIANVAEERRGCAVMSWWDGQGAAPVLAAAPGILLLERALGPRSLVAMAECGEDDEATRILTRATMRLHARLAPPPADLVPLEVWFRALAEAAATRGGLYDQAWATASAHLSAPRGCAVLHGDIHHGNVLDFGPKGWLAIDPKGLLGEPAYDFANILCNPPGPVPLKPGRLARRVAIIAEVTGIDRRRLAAWGLAYSALSAAWTAADGGTCPDLSLVEQAAAELRRLGT